MFKIIVFWFISIFFLFVLSLLCVILPVYLMLMKHIAWGLLLIVTIPIFNNIVNGKHK